MDKKQLRGRELTPARIMAAGRDPGHRNVGGAIVRGNRASNHGPFARIEWWCAGRAAGF